MWTFKAYEGVNPTEYTGSSLLWSCWVVSFCGPGLDACLLSFIRVLIKNCTALKRRVHDFIKTGELTFKDEDIPNVNENPLPNHGRPKVNAVESSQEMQVKKDIRDICIPMGLLYEALVMVG